ncbi:MAG TPA: hypothetical protein DEP35_12145, partial [Deltaproteobacteria bacterium]|nr:hypothetical protein [Deltaproteobacteria bacterium]
MPDVTPISRNAPCPCGSGLKHKRCCGRDAPMQWSGTSLWHRLRAAEDALMSAISSWAGRRYGLGLFDDAWKAFGATEDLDAPPHQHPEFGGLFLLWLYFRFDPETHDRDNRRDAARPLAL